MSRAVPFEPCLALLKQFEPDNPSPQQTIAAAAAYVEASLGSWPLADLNDGQFAALIDYVIWQGEAQFGQSRIRQLVLGGNLTFPPTLLAELGARGQAERQVWNAGNSV